MSNDKEFALEIYFKSGHKVTADHVSEYEVGSNNKAGINKLRIVQEKKALRIINLQSVDLSSIECIVKVRY